MSATPDQLPSDIEEMKRLFLAQAANIAKLTAELAAAKAGLMAYALQIEKLNFQLARLRRPRSPSSSCSSRNSRPPKPRPKPRRRPRPLPLPHQLRRRQIRLQASRRRHTQPPARE